MELRVQRSDRNYSAMGTAVVAPQTADGFFPMGRDFRH